MTYGAISGVHLMWTADVCREDVTPAGSIPADSEGHHTWLPDSGYLFAHAGSLMTLAGRGSSPIDWVAQRSAGMVPGFLKLRRQDSVIDLIPTPGGGTSEVHSNPAAHPRTGLLPYFSDRAGRVGYLRNADCVCCMEEIAEGVKLFGEGGVMWGSDRDLKPAPCASGITQRRILVLHAKAGLLVFDQFFGRISRGDIIRNDIQWVPYNISFFGEPWRNDLQCDHASSTCEDVCLVYAVPTQPMPFCRVDCSPYLSSKGPAYHFAVRPRRYRHTMLASRLAVQDDRSAVRPSIALAQVTQDHALAAYLADLDMAVAVNFAEGKQEIRAADASWNIEVAGRGVAFPRVSGGGS